MTSLSSLLEQSKRLQSSLATTTTNPSSSSQQQHNAIDPLPSLHLGFEQIEQQSRRVASRSLKENGAVGGGNAAYLLASGGVNADLLSSNINNVGNLAGTFEPLVPLSDTDVEGYLRHTHEQAIISAIEENRRQTTQDFYRSLDNRMRRDWERQKERLFEELGRHQPISSVVGGAGGVGGGKETPRKGRGGFESGSPSAPLSSTPASSSSNGGAGGSLQMHAKMMRYDRVIRRLNEFRKEGFAFGVVNALGEAASAGGQGGDARSTQLLDTYSLLSRLVNEHDVLQGEFQRTALQERQYAAGYLSRDQEAEGAREVRRMVAEGARGWLEEQFLSYVDKTIASRPAEANLGGVPSVQNKIRAFLNVRYGDGKGGWKGPALEIANGTPLWARIYYLLRSGHAHEALKFAEENSSALATLEKSFLAYFKAYLDSPTRRLPKLLRDRFLAEYNQRIRYLTDTSDPYKHALYKLIGRVEIQRRNVPGVTQTTEDWLWFQLSLVRESGGAEGEVEAPHEKYGLRDLAAVLRKFGEQHFDPKGTRPLLYFQVLLLSGQFERAIAFLAPHPAYHADAVHFAIALAYYGLLRVPADGQAKNGDGELLVDPTSPTPSLSFSRLLHRYTRLFARTDATEALQYLYLICLSADTNPGEIKVAQGLVRELVMETRQYGALLGDVRGDGTKVPGQIERDLKLLHLPDSRAYLLDIVKAAASRADLEQRFSEAILLYNLAEEYDAVISVLNVELGNSLSRPSATSSLAGPTSVANANKVGLAAAAAQEDVVAVAKSILEHYDRSAGMGGKVSRKRRETCECLMRLKEGLGLFERGELEAALATIESTSLLPLSPNSSTDLVSLIRQAESLPSLDDALVRNLDVVLVATMTILYRLHQQLRESPYGADGSRVQKMEELRARARGVMMFAGMLRYRLTNDTYSTLTKLDVYLN